MSVATIVFECGFIAALFVRRLLPIFLLAGLAMHLGIYVMMAAPFFQLMLMYIVFVPFERLPGIARLNEVRGINLVPQHA